MLNSTSNICRKFYTRAKLTRPFLSHASHHVLAVYALGASPELIRDVYKTHLPVLQPTLVSPDPITQENFIEHLGDERYYDGYLAFFTDYLQSHSPTDALERFIFSPEYNFRSDLAAADGPDSKEKVQPQMLNRFLAGLIHPFIHLAYGLEFGIIGQVVEGLAQAAVHGADQTELIPPSCFTNSATDTIADLSNLAHSLEIAGFGTGSAPGKRPIFAFHRRIRDAAFSVELPTDPLLQYGAVVKSIGGAIYDLVREWTEEWLDGVGARGGAGAEARLRDMVEEVVWGNVIWYGIGGWASRGTSGRGMNADFFNAHLVTSALFLPKLILKEESSGSSTPGLSFASRLLLLQTYLAVSAAWYVRRGCHALPIADFYAATDAQLFAPAGARAGAGWRQAPGSAWPRVIESGVRFPDEHAPKLVRALVSFAARWGTRPPGCFSAFAPTGEEKARTGAGRASAPALEGIESLDGTLFVRVAGLTFDRLGWVDEGEKAVHWDRDGIPMLDEYNARKSA
ncbi:hypothetical protein EDB92DRAFT_1884288 [Lactarius akahatsu]|uniref:Uncharacterized protein n=1 Tax=Lactarius akahatsu TaxID=416441 RepID=A0AAD4LBK9_9AGAM|nr:hypothetical protein EDB92DRAFT_1884288 [Lactarius akahatsu]